MRKRYDLSRGKRGAVVAPDPNKVRITINKAHREYIQNRTEPLEKTLRRVIREELRKKGAA